MVDVDVGPPSESRSELTKQTFRDLAHEAGFEVCDGAVSQFLLVRAECHM